MYISIYLFEAGLWSHGKFPCRLCVFVLWQGWPASNWLSLLSTRSCSASGSIVGPWYILNYILQDIRLSQLIERWELDLGEKAARRITWDAGAWTPPERTLRQKPNFICVPYGVFDFVQGVGPWDSTTQIWDVGDVDWNFQDEPIYWFRLHQTKHLYFFVFPALKPVGLEYFFSHPWRWTPDLGCTEILDFIAGLIPSQLRS